MTYKDYYKELGVSKTATPAEIKKAYRTLANKYHPDKNGGDKSAEERFKVISEANEVLRDPAKRKKYDQFGSDWKHYEEAGAKPGGFDWSKYSSGRSGQTNHQGQQGSYRTFNDDVDYDLFEMLFGQHNNQTKSKRSVVKGSDLEAEAIITLEETYNGTSRLLKLDGQTIKVSIKPGIANGQRLKISGKGSIGLRGGPKGDLFLSIKIAQHSQFKRVENDLHSNLPVDLYVAVLGGKTQFKSLKGNVTVNVPKGTQNGIELRLRGLGMPRYLQKNEFGDLFLKVNVILPANLSKEESELFNKLSQLRHVNLN
ncbi:MAG: DnaJ C-terminal domain-containing protein [Melioribacteraceae bacterium]